MPPMPAFDFVDLNLFSAFLKLIVVMPVIGSDGDDDSVSPDNAIKHVQHKTCVQLSETADSNAAAGSRLPYIYTAADENVGRGYKKVYRRHQHTSARLTHSKPPCPTQQQQQYTVCYRVAGHAS